MSLTLHNLLVPISLHCHHCDRILPKSAKLEVFEKKYVVVECPKCGLMTPFKREAAAWIYDVIRSRWNDDDEVIVRGLTLDAACLKANELDDECRKANPEKTSWTRDLFLIRLDKNLLDAAPEMLKVLEAICCEAESWHTVHGHTPSSVQCDSICELIPAKVAKVTMQMLIDVGFNAFGLQLFCESFAGTINPENPDGGLPFSFSFRGLRFTVEREPGEEIDTRHY